MNVRSERTDPGAMPRRNPDGHAGTISAVGRYRRYGSRRRRTAPDARWRRTGQQCYSSFADGRTRSVVAGWGISRTGRPSIRQWWQGCLAGRTGLRLPWRTESEPPRRTMGTRRQGQRSRQQGPGCRSGSWSCLRRATCRSGRPP